MNKIKTVAEGSVCLWVIQEFAAARIVSEGVSEGVSGGVSEGVKYECRCQ